MQLIFLAACEATGSCYLIESLNAAALAEVIQHQLK